MSATNETKTDTDSHVDFGHVEIRLYQRAISDNPSVTDGPPIGIDWTYDSEATFTVNEYEDERDCCRRSLDNLVIPRGMRQNILVEAGFSQKEIASAVRNALKAKNQRRQTINNLKAFAMEESVENMTRKVKKAFRFGKSKDLMYTQPQSRIVPAM